MKEKDQQRLIKRLKEKEEVIHSILDSSHDGIIVLDKDANIIYAGRSLENVCGLVPHKIIGKNINNLIKKGVIIPNEAISMGALKVRKRVASLLKLPGRKILTTATPYFGLDGNIKYVVSNVRNITELEALKYKLEETCLATENDVNQIYQVRVLDRLRKLGVTECLIRSQVMMDIIELIFSLQEFDVNYLITGETGTGKGLVAKIIHKVGARREMPFIEINCSAIPVHLLESELFGYRAGAFTGADRAGKNGLFEIANKGIIFLDEIGNMPVETQAKILKFLDDGKITPLGSSKSFELDIQTISATNADLKKNISEGSFRKDLFFRLNEVSIEIPPLRKRLKDLQYMIDYFWDKYNKTYHKNLMLDETARAVLVGYRYPGNVRELKNILKSMVLTLEGPSVGIEDLPRMFLEGEEELDDVSISLKRPADLQVSISSYEKEIIEKSYQESGSTYKAAKTLGISQSTFYRKAKKYGIID